jgi:hypothetical protein
MLEQILPQSTMQPLASEFQSTILTMSLVIIDKSMTTLRLSKVQSSELGVSPLPLDIWKIDHTRGPKGAYSPEL